MGCTYVKEFDFGTKKSDGGAVKYAKGGKVESPGFKGQNMHPDNSTLGIKGNKNPGIKGSKPVAPNLPTLKLAKGGACKSAYAEGGKVHSDVAMDKKSMAKAVHKHEKALHKGEPMTKLAKGGKVPRVEAMEKREMAETPSMRRESAMSSRKVQAPVRKMVPVASREPMLAMKSGGKASMC
jgi:ribosomal protein S6